MKQIVVFLGPSLPLEDARRRLDATYLPPVAQGDVLRLLDDPPAAIGIVDGLFEHVPSVWHKEILAAMEAGVHVAGAASMGALRAAELDRFGMVGIGQIYASYRSGDIEDDDEVAIAHADGEHGWRPLSEAMVNVRDHCRRAVDGGALDATLAARVVECAKALHYPDRRYPAILMQARAAGGPVRSVERFAAWLGTSGPNLKARDAIALLDHLAAWRARRPRRRRPAWQLERTEYLESLRLQVARERHGPGAPSGDAVGLRRAALLRVLVTREAGRQGVTVSDAEIQRAADDFRRDRGLHSRARTLAWLRARGLDGEAFTEFAESEALIRAVAERARWWEVEQQLAMERRVQRMATRPRRR